MLHFKHQYIIVKLAVISRYNYCKQKRPRQRKLGASISQPLFYQCSCFSELMPHFPSTPWPLAPYGCEILSMRLLFLFVTDRLVYTSQSRSCFSKDVNYIKMNLILSYKLRFAGGRESIAPVNHRARPCISNHFKINIHKSERKLIGFCLFNHI